MRLGEEPVDDARHIRNAERHCIGADGELAHVAGYGSRLHLPRVVSGRQNFVPVDPVLRRRESSRVAVGIGQSDLVLRSAAQVGPAEIRRALPDQLAVAGPHCGRTRIVERGYAVQQGVHHPVGVLARNAGLGLGRGWKTRDQEKYKRSGANHGVLSPLVLQLFLVLSPAQCANRTTVITWCYRFPVLETPCSGVSERSVCAVPRMTRSWTTDEALPVAVW